MVPARPFIVSRILALERRVLERQMNADEKATGMKEFYERAGERVGFT